MHFKHLLLLCLAACSCIAGQESKVNTLRVPDGGLQPQIAVDGKGAVHMLYYKGDASHGDIFYVRSDDGGQTFAKPIQVNSQAGSAIAMGNIRGATLALGKSGRVHAAWNGSGDAAPKGPQGQNPMLYTRMDDSGRAFEPQRNLIHSAYGLDGGGRVAADSSGNVYVFWHATGASKGEENRRVFVAHSSDDGKTFSTEIPAFQANTGACGCCGMAALADGKGNVYALYRAATEKVNRDIVLLVSKDKGATFKGQKLQEWKLNACPMSSASFVESPIGAGVLATWETKGQVYFSFIDPATLRVSPPISAPGMDPERKHSVLATNASGETILIWTEGIGWQKGGSVHWQVYDKNGRPTAEKGRGDGVPVWSLVAAFARPDGGFTVVY